MEELLHYVWKHKLFTLKPLQTTDGQPHCDLGGHQFAKGVSELDKELFVRWMQFGAFSPIMRTHSMKSSAMNKEPWVFNQEYLGVLRNTIRQRYQIAPYTYTMHARHMTKASHSAARCITTIRKTKKLISLKTSICLEMK